MHSEAEILKFIDSITSPTAIPAILDAVCRTTGMGFAAIAHVTEHQWIAYSVRDLIAFGLKPGDELKIEDTLCHDIRQSGKAIIINDVANDLIYSKHKAPKLHKFQSYISMPIMLEDGSFFGTICAIDPKPQIINTPQIINMFEIFAEVIGYYLSTFKRSDFTLLHVIAPTGSIKEVA